MSAIRDDALTLVTVDGQRVRIDATKALEAIGKALSVRSGMLTGQSTAASTSTLIPGSLIATVTVSRIEALA